MATPRNSGRSQGAAPAGNNKDAQSPAAGLSDSGDEEQGYAQTAHQTGDSQAGTDQPGMTQSPTSPLISEGSAKSHEGDPQGQGGPVRGGADRRRDSVEAQEFGARSGAPEDVRDHVKAVINQNKELVQPTVVRNLLITYTITVAVVIVLSLSGQIAVHVYIENSKSDAVVINVSGRQRLLSQLLVKDAATFHFLIANKRNPNLTYFIDEMTARYPLWAASQGALINGSDGAFPNLPAIPGTGDSRILNLSSFQQPHFDAMSQAIQGILSIPGLATLAVNSTLEGQLADYVDVLLQNEGPYWKYQDSVTLIFQENADGHLTVLLILTWVILGLVILTLVLEGLLVFWPVARSMQRLIDERFSLIRRSLETEAENRGVSMLMMGYISHELQLPLASLEVHLDNTADYLHSLEAVQALDLENPKARDEGDPLVGCSQQVEKARLCSELLNSVSRDIFNLRNIELGRMVLTVEVIDVADVIQQVLSVLAPKVPPRVQLRMEVDPAIEEQKRQLDRHRLQQILLNLVDNAFVSTNEGDVVVRAKEGLNAASIRFEVQDSGEGLTEEQRQSLYEPVLDSSGLRSGKTNLALYVVKLLVELQDGKYGMEAIPGRGNIHWVELPSAGNVPAGPTNNPGGMQTVQESTEVMSEMENSTLDGDGPGSLA